MMTVECAGCRSPILDRFLLHFLDKTWHSTCVKCQLCRKLLDEKCFYKEGKIYCRDDFYRCYGPKCSGCGNGIVPQDYVRKVRPDRVYHLTCFACSVCSKQLTTGEVLYLQPAGDDTTPILMCKDDYLKTSNGGQADALFSDDEDDADDRVSIPGLDASVQHLPPHLADGALLQPHLGLHPHLHHQHPLPSRTAKLEANNNNGEDVEKESRHSGGSADLLKGDDSESVDGDGDAGKGEDAENKSPDGGDGAGGKRRGPRTTIKAKQLEVLKQAFAQTPKPTRHIREQLAKETGLSMRVIQVWFQNKRSKERRMKQMTNGMMAGRGFFPGKGGRRGFPLIGDDFGYFPHDKPYHEFGYPPFGPPPDGFFPGPMGFMGPPGGPGMDSPLPMHGGPLGLVGGPGGGPGGPGGLHPGALGPPLGPPQPPGSGPGPNSGPNAGDAFANSGDDAPFDLQPQRPSPDEFHSSGGGGANGPGFSSSSNSSASDQQHAGEQIGW